MPLQTTISLTPIGVVRSEFKSKVGVPIQTAGAPQLRAELEVLPDYVAGLGEGLDAEAALRGGQVEVFKGDRQHDVFISETA